jgi:hypothetical protein
MSPLLLSTVMLSLMSNEDTDMAAQGQRHRIVCNGCIFHGERMESADGVGKFEGDLLDRVDHGFVFFDHAGDVIQGIGQLV